MGWFGYGLYDGDGTQSCHLDYLKWTIGKRHKNGVGLTDDEIDDCLGVSGTKIPEKYKALFLSSTDILIKKLPKIKKYWNEYDAIAWQMALSLFLDSNIVPPEKIYLNGRSATEWLISERTNDFNESFKRRRVLRNFLKKTENILYSYKKR